MQRVAPTIDTVSGFGELISGYLKSGDRLALLLDYDGTLAPVTDHPSNTYMLPRTAAVLARLVVHPRVSVSVISGRGRADVQRRVGLEQCTYSGNHGLEIRQPDGSEWHYEVPAALRQNFGRLVQVLDERVSKAGAWVENKLASLTFHYREAPPEMHAELHAEARTIIESLGFVACEAQCAIEAKPPVRWNKGDAALRILGERFGGDWHADGVRVIFAGDDLTDEDAMRALQGRARTFRVSAVPSVQTYADYRLGRQDMVTELLEWIERTL